MTDQKMNQSETRGTPAQNTLWWSIQFADWFSFWGLRIGFASLLAGVTWVAFTEAGVLPHAGMWHLLPLGIGAAVLVLRAAVRRGA